MKQAPEILEKVEVMPPPSRLDGDASYEAEWFRQWAVKDWKTKTVIKPRDTSKVGARRLQMNQAYLKRQDSGRRWHAESFWCGLKRITSPALASRQDSFLLNEASFRFLAYALHRQRDCSSHYGFDRATLRFNFHEIRFLP